MKKIKKSLFTLLIVKLLFLVTGLTGTEVTPVPGKRPYRIPAITAKIKVDGLLDEKVWQEALQLELDYEVEPGENISPPVKTRVFLAYNQKYMYVGFRSYDPDPREIRARYTDRDHINNDDYVGILLDTFNDSRMAYVFMCNPHGIQADHITSPLGDQIEWDGIWNSAARITREGYEVEIAIPFSTLRFQGKKDGQVWGIDAVRSYPRKLSHLVGLFPRDRNNNCYLCQAVKTFGFQGIKPGLNLELDPTLSALVSQEREGFTEGKFVQKEGKVDPGLTARWSFTSNLTFSVAINPDFSNVEADAAQLDINRQFALFYPEKRPFFLEGLGIFTSTVHVVHTRAIADPTWGIKLTGKEGRHALGFFSVQDRITNLLFPGPETSRMTSMNMRNMSTVFRYRWDMGHSSNLGLFFNNREGGDYFNRVVCIDGDLKFLDKNRILFEVFGSQTRYPEEIADAFQQPREKFKGTFLDAAYIFETEKIFFYIMYQDAHPDFRTDLSFITQTGYKLYVGGGEYRWRRNPGHWFTTIKLGGTYQYATDQNNNLLQKMVQANFNYHGPLQSMLYFTVNMGKRTYLGKEFDDNFVDFAAQVRPSGSLLIAVSGGGGDQVDITHIQAGKFLRFNPIIQYNLGRHLYLQVDHVFERLKVDAGRLYTANLSNIKMVYQFTARAFLRTILQYADIRYNPALYTDPQDPRFKHLFSQILFSYKINPQTVLFLGYSDDYYGIYEIKQAHRTFFLKIGYALVL
jgi:hypothetical protein